MFGALQFLNSSLRGGAADWERVLTDLDPGRTLEIMLTVEPRDQDREEFIDLVSTTEAQKRRRAEMLNSPLMRRIEYAFKAPIGQPHLLHLRHTKVMTHDLAVTRQPQRVLEVLQVGGT